MSPVWRLTSSIYTTLLLSSKKCIQLYTAYVSSKWRNHQKPCFVYALCLPKEKGLPIRNGMIFEICTFLYLNSIETFKNFTWVQQSHAKFHRKRNNCSLWAMLRCQWDLDNGSLHGYICYFCYAYIIMSSYIKYEMYAHCRLNAELVCGNWISCFWGSFYPFYTISLELLTIL